MLDAVIKERPTGMAATPILLDWTADRLRAWSIASTASPRPLALDGTDTSLPLAISMAERRLQVGRVASKLVRQQPHQVIECFLPYVGQDRTWHHARHTLDARDALLLVINKLKEKPSSKSVFHAVPSYWNREQAAILEDLTRQAGGRCLGTIKRGLALAGLAPGLTIDIDSFAVTITQTQIQGRAGHLHLEKTRTLTDLALPIWTERIASLVAARCMRDCRRDPRAHAETDQQLHEQILNKLYDWASLNDARLSLQHRDWQDEVLVPVTDVNQVCASLAQRLAQSVLQKPDAQGWFLSPEASHLPAVAQALYQGGTSQRSLSVLPQEVMPLALTNWILQIEQGISPPPQLSDAFPVVSEGKPDVQPDTLPFLRRHTK